MQRRVQQTDGNRQVTSLLKQSLEIVFEHRAHLLVQDFNSRCVILGQNHRSRDGDAFRARQEHVLRAAQSDALRAKIHGKLQFRSGIGVCVHAQTLRFFHPTHELGHLRVLFVHALTSGVHFNFSVDDEPFTTIQRNPIAGFHGGDQVRGRDAFAAVEIRFFLRLVHSHGRDARNARQAPSTSDDGGVRRHATVLRQETI